LSSGAFARHPRLTAARMPDLDCSAMHRLSHLYSAVACEPVPQALAALVKRLRT
jgi:hypothetical protein